MAKMPDHQRDPQLPPQTTTAVPCNHVFPYWSVIPPTHCPCSGAILSHHRRRSRALPPTGVPVVACAERCRGTRAEATVTARTRARVDPSNQRRSTNVPRRRIRRSARQADQPPRSPRGDKVICSQAPPWSLLTTLGTIDTGSDGERHHRLRRRAASRPRRQAFRSCDRVTASTEAALSST